MVMICGIDEAGRGPIVGPLVVAGIWITEELQEKLILWGVKDSKKHSPRTRQTLAQKIKDIASHYEVTVPACDIDSLRQEMTLNELEQYIFVKVAEYKSADVYFLDAVDVDSNRFKINFQQGLKSDAKIVAQHKADELYPVVSAASILAKTCRDNAIMEISQTLEPQLGIPLGSGYPSDPVTRKFLEQWGKKFGNLPPHTRHSWKTAKTLKKKLHLKE
jgi:ribonuclease HII